MLAWIQRRRGLFRVWVRSRWMGRIFPCLFIALSGTLIAAAVPKRVLIVHSFGNAAPPFTTHAIAFETELTEKMGEQVDLDEVYLDVARYTTLDMEEALVELIQKRQTRWQPDLVVPIGSPAGVFVARYRDRLFPKETPVVYTGMDQRRLPAGTLERNAAFVGESFDLPGLVEDILQIAPETTNIAVVIGASPLERYWAEVLREEYKRFASRVTFTWWNGLSLDQMLERAAAMPPHSFILLVLLMRDASGVSHNADEALRRLHDVANAPIASIFEHQLGLGIIGGRLYQAALEGIESARVAVRVLHGEPATNFPPRIVGTLPPTYDWRELQRWGFSENRLPPGSVVQFRTPSTWERYKWRIATILGICGAQAVLIALLVANLVKRRRAERSLAETEARFRTAADTAPLMIWVSNTRKLCTFFNKQWLEFTGRTMEQELGNGWAQGVHPDEVTEAFRTYESAFDARRPFTIEYRLRKRDGEYAWVLDHGVPRFASDGIFLGYIGALADITTQKQAEERWRSVVESTPNAMLVIDADGKIVLANARTEGLFGFTRAEMIGRAAEMLIFHESEKQNGEQNPFTPGTVPIRKELTGRRKDGGPVPVEVGLNTVSTPTGQIVLVSITDLTERLAAEARLRESEKQMSLAADAAHLGMMIWDPRQTYMWTSPKWKNIHGYSTDDKIRFEALIERIHPHDRDVVARTVMEAFAKQTSYFVQHRILLPDGKVRWISKTGRVEQTSNNGPLRLLTIAIDISDRKEAEEAAREVSGKLITAQEDERRRIARDLHDDLNQRLAMLSVEADLLGRMEHSSEAQPLIEDIASRVKGLSTEVHKLSYQLHPAKLEQLGLVTATRALCQEQSKLLGIAIEFSHREIPHDLNRVTALCIFRIVQEALQNVGKHSHATRGRVELKCDGREIRLFISDNGLGFDMTATARHGGLGLVGMRERVRLAHGQIVYHSDLGHGTQIEVTVPVCIEENAARAEARPG